MKVVLMSEREFSRLDVLSDLDSGRIRVDEACDLLGLKRRQVFGFWHDPVRLRAAPPTCAACRRNISRATTNSCRLRSLGAAMWRKR
jgi:hypothetical protein